MPTMYDKSQAGGLPALLILHPTKQGSMHPAAGMKSAENATILIARTHL